VNDIPFEYGDDISTSWLKFIVGQREIGDKLRGLWVSTFFLWLEFVYRINRHNTY